LATQNQVSFLDDGLYGVNDLGHLMKWNLDTYGVRWSIQVSRVIERRQELQRKLEPQSLPTRLPLPFTRVAAAIFPGNDPKHVLTLGQDAAVREWNTDTSHLRQPITEIKPKTGQGPSIVFDPNHSNILWALDKSAGTLWIIDTERNHVLDSKRNVHPGGKVGIYAL